MLIESNRGQPEKANRLYLPISWAIELSEKSPAHRLPMAVDALINLVKQYQQSRDSSQRLELADRIVVRLSPDLHLFITLRAPTNLVDDVLQDTLITIALGLDTFEGDTDSQF